MKVICIDVSFSYTRNGKPHKGAHPKEGEIVTVTGQDGEDYYFLLEYPTIGKQKCSWIKSKFIPLSNIDETELVKEKLEIVNH